MTSFVVRSSLFRAKAPGLPQGIQDLNVGIIALAANIIVLVVVSALTHRMRVAEPV